MAGRKSKTATVNKPKASQKTTAPSAAKRGANPPTVAPPANRKRVQAISAADVDVYAELERLSAYIDAARREIALIHPEDVKEEYVPGATDQLDAVVEATADATNAIMDCCDEIHDVMGDVSPSVGTKLTNVTTRIYEACTFQDITGQRIGKVVSALKNIEARVDALVLAFGDETVKPQKTAGARKSAKNKKTTDADLLEGPQLSEKAKNQAEIDDLLASFD